jgi:hypothetical protein
MAECVGWGDFGSTPQSPKEDVVITDVVTVDVVTAGIATDFCWRLGKRMDSHERLTWHVMIFLGQINSLSSCPILLSHTDRLRQRLMAHNTLLTGVSGYLGGTLLHEWKTSGPLNNGIISALVRNEEQAKEVAKYGVEPLIMSLEDEDAIVKALVERNITIVYYLIGSYWLESQLYFIKGLAEVKRQTGDDVHFLYVRTGYLRAFPATVQED